MGQRYDDLTREELLRLLEARDRRDATKFGLVWEANEIERDKALNNDFVALDLAPELSVGTAPWRNLIIEGDNFDALRYLRMTFAGQVKCILVDPPYNTGKKDFVYNDRFMDENNSWRFSTWLEFLYQRFVIAHDLLREDGVLLCCINDDNRAKLEMLLDKVFPGMRLGSMTWRTRDSTSAKGRNFSDVHEHILIYARPGFQFRGREKSQKKYKNPDNDPRGPWNIDPLARLAGHLAESFSAIEPVVWFWFAPFKGVTGQTAAALRAELPGLRLRELSEDRQAADSRAGDVFVTTWQTVATREKGRRNVHKPGEQNLTVEELIAGLRQKGLRIGVVVDEAHHGFFGGETETQAMKFFREILQPEYTVLVTATPDDVDIAHFQKALGLTRLNRITIGRGEPVDEGLIKEGIKCVAYFAPEGQQALVDFEGIALREGAMLHERQKAELKKMEVKLTPLMLVQVDSSDKSVERAKERLLKLGFTEGQIAVHTADEPDSSLLALANDESREVLVFKMAVALGFDAPRAGILVSMRAARDEDFGVQLVGRILRVHRRLQGRARAKTLPVLLRYGYVFLADAEAQVGLDLAGQRINKMQTEFAKVSPTTAIMWIGNKAFVQGLGPDGQTQLFPVASPIPAHLELRESGEGGTATVTEYGGFTLDLLTGIYTPPNLPTGSSETSSKPRATGVITALRAHKYDKQRQKAILGGEFRMADAVGY